MHKRPETLIQRVSKTLNADKPIEIFPDGPTAYELIYVSLDGLSHNTVSVKIVHDHDEGWSVGLLQGLDRDQILALLEA